jgi:hypothetical protein
MRKLILTLITIFAFGLFAAAQTPGGTTGANQNSSQGTNSAVPNSNNSSAPVSGAATDPSMVNGDQQRKADNQSATDQSSADKSSMSKSDETTLEGCVTKEQSDYFIQPMSGERERLTGSQDFSSKVGKNVKVNGTEQTTSASATDRTSTSGSASSESQNNAAGSIAGNAGSANASGTGASGSANGNWTGKDFMVTKIETISESCPASTQK